MFAIEDDENYVVKPKGKTTTSFLLGLIARVQTSATMLMVDMRAYAKWLAD